MVYIVVANMSQRMVQHTYKENHQDQKNGVVGGRPDGTKGWEHLQAKYPLPPAKQAMVTSAMMD